MRFHSWTLLALLGPLSAAWGCSYVQNQEVTFSSSQQQAHEVAPLQPRAWIARAQPPVAQVSASGAHSSCSFSSAVVIEIPRSLRSEGVLYAFRFTSPDAALRFQNTPAGVGLQGRVSESGQTSQFVLPVINGEHERAMQRYEFDVEITPYRPSGLKGTPVVLHYEQAVSSQ